MSILFHKSPESGIAEIVFNRPKKRNALDGAILEGILKALDELGSDESIKVLITSGAGEKAYTAGMDLHYLRQISGQDRPWGNPPLSLQIVAKLRSLPQITISKIRGYCLGGGITLMVAHELAIAAESSWFGAPEVMRGEFGKFTTASLFHSGLSPKKAFLLQLTGDHIDGREAERLGLVSGVVPDNELDEYVAKLAQRIASFPRSTLEHAKIAAYLAQSGSLEEAYQTDDLVSVRLRQHLDPLAKVDDFLASRKGRDE